MIRFIFKFDEERLGEYEEKFANIKDKNYKCVADAISSHMFGLFNKEGVAVVAPCYNGDEFYFDQVIYSGLDKIREVVEKIGFEIVYDSEDNHIHLEENYISANYLNEKGLNGIEFAGEKTEDVISSLTIYFDRGDNKEREEDIINNL